MAAVKTLLLLLQFLGCQAELSFLFALTGHTELGDTGEKTGYYLSEAAHPWKLLRNHGVSIDYVSPKGGPVFMDPRSFDLEDPINLEFYNSDDFQSLENTMRPDEVDVDKYLGILYVGGHGAMWDFPYSPELAQLATDLWQDDKIVSAVCHGPAGLLNITLDDGSHLIKDKKVAGFTLEEEEFVELDEVVPYPLATELESRGAVHLPGSMFEENVVVQGKLVTGQNPKSATKLGEELVKIIQHMVY